MEFKDIWELPNESSYKVPKTKSGLKLELNLIPASSFGSNLRKKLGRKWDTLSKRIRGERRFICDICNAKGKTTHLHEVWEFDEKNKIQKLIGFECICVTCHSVHHWGLSKIQGKNMNALMNHACNVNQCKRKVFNKHLLESFETWRRRSDCNWTLNLDFIKYL